MPHNNSQSGADSSNHGKTELGAVMHASKGAFIVTGLFSMIINILMLTGPLFMLQIYDRVLSSGSIPTLVALFILVAILFAFLGLLEMVRSRVMIRVGARMAERLSSRVFSAIIKTSIIGRTKVNTGGALAELEALRQFLSGNGPFVFFDAPWVFLYIGVIFFFHWTLGLLALVGAIVLFILALLNDFRTRKLLISAAQASGTGNKFVETGRRNAEVLTVMGMQKSFLGIWKNEHDKALSQHVEASDRGGTISSITKGLRLFLQSAMLAAGAALAVQQLISPGTMIAASIIMGRALQPVEQGIGQWRGFVRARQAYRMLNNLLAATQDVPQQMDLPVPKGAVKVEHLRIAVPGTQKLILNNVNFAIKPGSGLGVVGPSASGKSSLLRALTGIWMPVGGSVRLDNATLDQWDPEILGKHIGYLPQDVELFAGTVKDNISRFDPDASGEDVISAAQNSGIHEMVLQLTGGYDFEVGDFGENLSAGQRQRVGLARALYHDPPLILLDEPNSNLDVAGDIALTQTILGLRARGRTVIIVAHRKSAIEAVDQLLYLEAGSQQLFGPKDEVLRSIAESSQKAASQKQARLAASAVKQ